MERKQHLIKFVVIAVALASAILLTGYSIRKDATKASVSRLTFEPTPARMDRGRYLVEGAAHSHKILDTRAIDGLYKAIRATIVRATVRKETSMLMNRTYQNHPAKWQPCAATHRSVCSLVLALSLTNVFGGKLGQEQSIDSRKFRQ